MATTKDQLNNAGELGLKKAQLNRAGELGLRIGRVIHLPTAVMESEHSTDDFNEFFEEGAIPFLFNPTDCAEQERLNETVNYDQVEQLATFFRGQPRQFLVRLEYQIPTKVVKNSTWRDSVYTGGWGYYQREWVLVDSIEDALLQGFLLVRNMREKIFNDQPKKTNPKDGLPF